MRLDDLFESNIIVEDPFGSKQTPGDTIALSMADLYDMTGKPYPMVKGFDGRETTPEGFFTKSIKDRSKLDAEFVQAYDKYKAGGSTPGYILGPDGTMESYNENHYLEDMSWEILSGGAEWAAGIQKGGAKLLDDYINNFTMHGQLYKKQTGKNISNMSKATLTGYYNPEEKHALWLDRLADKFKNNTDQDFRMKVDATAGAVDTWGNVTELFMNKTGFNWEGATGIMAGELPSEIVDLALMGLLPGGAGMAVTGIMNGLEAGGMAAQEITQTINKAYKEGRLQETGQFQMYLDAAMQQLREENAENPLGEDQMAEQAMDLARRQAIDMSINNAFYQVAVIGGVIDAVQNKILYKGPLKGKFLKNAFMKGVANSSTEAVSEYTEQFLTNVGIRTGAGEIVGMTEGALNAAYNGFIASQSGNALSTTQDAAIRVRGSMGRFAMFVMQGRRDPNAILDIMAMNPTTLINRIQKIDPETGVTKFSISDLIKERLITSDQLNKAQKKALARKGRVIIDGKQVTSKQIRENDDNVELVSLLDNLEINDRENFATANLNSEEEARRLAQLLSIKVDGKPVKKKTDINKVLKALEEVRKIDVRIAGRSTLEPPTWGDLDDRQKMQYWKEGKVTFESDPDRGNQTWNRKEILFNTRRNGETIPEEIANLADNTAPRPDLNLDENVNMRDEIAENEKNIALLESGIAKNLERRQKAWDNQNPDADPNNPDNPRPTAQSLIDSGEYYVGLGTEFRLNELKLRNQTIKTEVQLEARAWDQKFGSTHTVDGAAKASSALFNSAEALKAKIKAEQEAEKKRKEAIEKAKREETPNLKPQEQAPHVPVNDPVNKPEETSLSRKHYVANAKLKIANAEMESDELDAFLKASENVYPGSSAEIISQEDREKYQKVDLRPEVKANVSSNIDQPSDVVANTRPPQGTIATVDGKRYVWLGVRDGVGGMWATLRPDDTPGTTNHQNHDKLMKTWRDGNLPKQGPKLEEKDPAPNPVALEKQEERKIKVQTTAPKAPNIDGADELDIDVSTTDDPPEVGEVPFLVPPTKPGDERLKDMKVPNKVSQDFANVLATNNAIQVQTFLDNLPPAQASKLRFDYEQGNFDVQPTITKPAELGDPPPAPEGPNFDPTTPPPPTDQEGGVGGTDGEVSDVTGDDATQQGGRGTPETPAQSAERVRLYKQQELAKKKAAEIQKKAREKAKANANALADIEAQADQAARDAEAKRDAEREKTPDLRPDGPNMLPKVKKIQTTPDGPMNFVDPKTLTPKQKAELDKIAQDNQDQADDAMYDPDDKGADAKQKARDNTEKLNKKDDFVDIFKGHTNDEIDMIRQDGDNLRALDAKKKREAGLKQQTPPVAPFVPTDPRTKLKVTSLPNQNRTTKPTKTDKTGLVRQLGAFFGKNNDDSPDSSMMNFKPAKYPDPLDLDKYKGAAQRTLKGPARQ